nr:MAG TPA: butirosin biosynthesis protein [Bacteriophage sp.]
MKVSYPTDDVINIDHPFGNSLQNGFFPIGFYHCWHGGVHIEGKGKAIKAIADGKIIAFRYSKNEIEVGTKDGKPISLYNNFVLMRHDYKSGSHTLTLYSLYYHLFFGEEKPAPPQEKKYKAVPAVNGGYKLSGIWSVDKTVFFPTHTALNIKEEKEDYYVVNGKDINNVPQKEIRIPKTYGNEKKPTVNKGKVRWTSIAYKDQKGILLYYTEGESKIARKAIAVGSTVTVKNDSDAEWIEILYEGEVCFLKKGELKDGKLQEVTTDSAKTPSKPNKNNNFPPFLQNQKLIEGVQTCDIAVKAGELIGYVGKQGIYNQPDYYATHLEVFTPGNYNKVNEKGDIIDRMGMYQFIHNIKNDKYIEGAGQKRYFELKKGTVLKPYLKVSSEDYKGVIVTIDAKKKTENYTQVIPTQIIKELPENSYEKPIGKRNGKNFHYRDIVTHKRKAFWVRNNYIEEVPRKREKNKVDYKLKGDTPCLYLTNPDEETKYRDNEQQKRICEFKNTLSRMVLIDKSKCKEITYEGKKWLYVKSYYYEGNKIIYNYGWIEHPKEEELFSAHCWNKFGFSCQDAEDHRIYPIKGVNHYSGTSEFINKMISLLDENGDRIIDNKELRAKYNSPDTYHILSKMVCKHQSEWSYSWERIKEDAKAYFKYHFPKAKDAEIEKKLEFTEKVFDATYTFWGELKDKLSGQDKTFFKEGIFWYFEPFAWVTQMKKVFIPDIDLSDPDKWISQFTQPRPNFACYRTCCLILNNYGITCGGLGDTLKEKYSNGSSKFSNVIQVVVQKSDGTLENTGDEKEAIDYINSELEKGHPIVVGVDKEGEKKDLNYDHTTEHFIVITGRKTDEKGIYYRFFDVGTHSENKNLKGINPNNRLYLQEDYNLIGNIPQSHKKYTLAQVRKNL